MTTFETLAKEIHVAALLGTDRQAFMPPQVAGPLGETLALLASRPPEARLLGAATAVLLYGQAGLRARVDTLPAPEPSERDSQPVVAAPVWQRLATMLSGSRRDVLPEALALLADGGWRVPEGLLPDLLQAGKQQKHLRPGILAVLGRRGHWLAAQNPEWAYAGQTSLEGLFANSEAPSDGDEIWQTGNRTTRLLLMQELRLQSPDQARALLESTWTAERAEERAEFMSALAEGLGMADEPFLEAALDDRSREVRRAAIDLLARIPESRLVQRLIERAAPLLALKKPLLGERVLEASPPATFESDWRRDGIEEKSPYGELGDRAGWLAQILALTPPGIWETRFHATPEVLVQAAARGEWAAAVIQGLRDAAKRAADGRWSEALARHWLTERGRKSQPTAFSPHLAGMTSPSFEALILEALRLDSEPLHDLHPALSLLSEYHQPWSEALSRPVIDSVRRRRVQGGDKNINIWRTLQMLRLFALRIPPKMADELSQGWEQNDSDNHYWQNSVDEFQAILHFRHDLHKEIAL